MSNEQQKIQDPEMIAFISELRMDCMKIIDKMNTKLPSSLGASINVHIACIAEMILSKRELQSARHWLGECLSFYDTGYRVTDNPKDPGSESKAV
jgi:hypothetical protein